MGLIPASAANFDTALPPNMLAVSVMAKAGAFISVRRLTKAGTFIAPSDKEYAVCTLKCINFGSTFGLLRYIIVFMITKSLMQTTKILVIKQFILVQFC